MKKGLVIGKFMPLHLGHIQLIDFALEHCDELTVAIVCKKNDRIPIEKRIEWFEWLKETRHTLTYEVVDEALPVTQTIEPDAAKMWIDYFANQFAGVDVIISSEQYGEMLAEAMKIEHICYDLERNKTQISGREILNCPESFKQYVPEIVMAYLTQPL